ncbi:MAG: cupin domain-containing protein [Epulopiscium sp.]|nr:cupin domain-containing protein [Candidatus Epulonipiscium sp.]
MLEKKYNYSIIDDKRIERIIDDENINLNHMVLPKGAALPEHYSNSNVYMIIVRGTLTIRLDEEKAHEYQRGQIINIPYNVKMNVGNNYDEVLEFFVVKSPNPKNYRG